MEKHESDLVESGWGGWSTTLLDDVEEMKKVDAASATRRVLDFRVKLKRAGGWKKFDGTQVAKEDSTPVASSDASSASASSEAPKSSAGKASGGKASATGLKADGTPDLRTKKGKEIAARLAQE